MSQHSRAQFPFMERASRLWVDDEVVLGSRVATYLSNEAEGWGAWVNAWVLKAPLSHAVQLHTEWVPDPGREYKFPTQRQRTGTSA